MKAATATQEETKQETSKEKAKRLMKEKGLVQKSLSVRIQECELFDWDTTARATLLVIGLGQRAPKDDYSTTWVQEDCPWTAEEMVGYCDFAEWRIAQRVGKTERQIGRVIKKLEKRGVIHVDRWVDSNGASHNRYKVVEAVINDNQRPEHKRHAERPKRNTGERKGNKGSFSTVNQPGMKLAKAVGDDE